MQALRALPYLLLALVAAPALGALVPPGPPVGAAVALQLVAGNLDDPVHVTHAGDARLFVVERPGRVLVVANGAVLATPFLDIRPLVGAYYLEQGLLSIAFAPDYATSGRAYVSYTDTIQRNVLARYTVDPTDPNRLDPASAEILLTIVQPFFNHNGGLAAFGPDGYLYWGIGDGGLADDPFLNGQNTQTLLGTILRLDVSGPSGYSIPPSNPFASGLDGRPEVWAYGLRNPWRFSFDRQAGDLWIADVGQNEWEEIDFAAFGTGAGANYGWNVYEGNHAYRPEIFPPPTPYVFPVYEYHHSEGCSVTGGFVYRGSVVSALSGLYVFGDYCGGKIWALDAGYARSSVLTSGLEISTFGEDAVGELYVAHLGLAGPGAVYRLV